MISFEKSDTIIDTISIEKDSYSSEIFGTGSNKGTIDLNNELMISNDELNINNMIITDNCQ